MNNTIENEFILSDGKKLNAYLSCAIAEGFCEGVDYEGNTLDQLKAWSYIGKKGLYKSLQGWYGRTLFSIVDQGLLDKEFNANYEAIEDIN